MTDDGKMTDASSYSNGFIYGAFGVIGFDLVVAFALHAGNTAWSPIGLLLFLGQFLYVIPIVVLVCFASTRNIAWGMLSAASVAAMISLGLCFGGMWTSPYQNPAMSTLNRLNSEQNSDQATIAPDSSDSSSKISPDAGAKPPR